MYRVKILADSRHPASGSRLVSFLIEFPRVVLAETVTHRLNSDAWGDGYSWCERTTTPDVSKNSASSRAIPHERFLKKIDLDPYMPAFTGKAKGMQGAYLEVETARDAAHSWLRARDAMVAEASYLNALGVHKQDSNRLLEPWAWVTQVVTSSRWDNFFALRCHEAAHPAFRAVARFMYLAYRASTPTTLSCGDWHVPFSDSGWVRWDVRDHLVPHDRPVFATHDDARIDVPIDLWRSVARCAWTSYENHDKIATDDAVLATVDRLVGSRPVHASPAEAQALCVEPGSLPERYRSNLGDGWLQLRKLLPAEVCDHYAPTDAEVAAWPETAAFADLPA